MHVSFAVLAAAEQMLVEATGLVVYPTGSAEGEGWSWLGLDLVATCLTSVMPTTAESVDFHRALVIPLAAATLIVAEGWMQTAPAAECVGGTVVYPGLLEHRRMMERKRHGIPLHKDIVGWLWEQGKALGVRECLTEIKT
ncbi:hypothetical protein CYMTET_46457 [Cymbomonas tetramitiformis]|uniref:Uncharacterized protein n=1 Tax=Cymbomonas tetramitiformis TaxID=36881 RepID=A0AAE0BW35_9CHLO|nr:hypothetical protein CYMTET_46457 [Cymbomonas tetramitiformis]